MPRFSSFTPFGMLAFSGAPSVAEKIYDALGAQYDQAFDTTPGGVNSEDNEAEKYALAMHLARAQLTLQRAGDQRDVSKATDLLPLREADFLASPGANDTIYTRQQRLVSIRALKLGASQSNIAGALQAALGSGFVRLQTLSFRQSAVDMPVSNFAPPGIPWQVAQLTTPVAQPGSSAWVSYTGVDPTIPVSFTAGTVVTVQGENNGLADVVTITATRVLNGAQQFQGYFNYSHDVGATVTSGPYCRWTSSMAFLLIVLTPAAATSPTVRAQIDAIMQKLARGVTGWAEVASQGGNTGPFTIGTTSLGTATLSANLTSPIVSRPGVTIPGHFTLVRTTWTGNPTPDNFYQLDQRAFQVIVEAGGTWAPTTQISFISIVTGFGLQLQGPLVVWGPSGTLTTTPTSGAGSFRCAVGDFEQLGPGHAGSTRVLTTPGLTLRANPWGQAVLAVDGNGNALGGIQTAAAVTSTAGASAQITELVADLEVHNGAVLTQVQVNFAVGQPHTSLPTMPKVRILRVKADGTGAVSLTSAAAGADSQGFFPMPPPASPSAYYNGGNAQSFIVPCDQHNKINSSSYFYWVQVFEEVPATTTNVLAPVDIATNWLDDAIGGGGTVDGVLTEPGMRMLIWNQQYPASNGVYKLLPDGSGVPGRSGNYVRVADLSSPSQFVSGTQVPVKLGGTLFGGTTFVLNVPTSNPVVGGTAGNWQATQSYGTGATIRPTTANGYLYTCKASGETGSTEPGSGGAPPYWPTVSGGTILDGSITWVCSVDASTPFYFAPIGATSPPQPPTWLASTLYYYGAVVQPSVPNGFVYILADGALTTGTTEPVWATQAGTHTSDNGGYWIALANTYAFGGVTPPQGNVWLGFQATFTSIPSLQWQ